MKTIDHYIQYYNLDTQSIDYTNSFVNKKVKNTKPICNFRISSNIIVESLIKIGICFNKTNNFNLKIDDSIIQGSYFFDFLRGLIDGDGSITSESGSFVIYGNNVEMYDQISKKLKEHYSEIYITINKLPTSCYELRVSNNGKLSTMKDFRNFITSKIWYKNCFCLTRKIPKLLNQENTEVNI